MKVTDIKKAQSGTAAEYTIHGQFVAGTDSTGRSVRFSYTTRGNLATESYYGGSPTTYEYGPTGLLTKTVTVHGDVTEFKYGSNDDLADVLHNGESVAAQVVALSSSQLQKTNQVITASQTGTWAGALGRSNCKRPGKRDGSVDWILVPGKGTESSSDSSQSLPESFRNECCRDPARRTRECCRCDPQNPDHRGRIQAQDSAPTPYEDSVPWAQCEPFKFIEAVMAVDTLMARMPPAQAKKRKEAPLKAKKYFYQKMLEGGAQAVDVQTFKDSLQPNARIDAEVRKGKAYAP